MSTSDQTFTETIFEVDSLEPDDFLIHYICCRDHTLTMCGGYVFAKCDDDEEGPCCVVCEDLNQQPTCPCGFGECPINDGEEDD